MWRRSDARLKRHRKSLVMMSGCREFESGPEGPTPSTIAHRHRHHLNEHQMMMSSSPVAASAASYPTLPSAMDTEYDLCNGNSSATDDSECNALVSQSVCLSVCSSLTWLCRTKTAELIEVRFGVETAGNQIGPYSPTAREWGEEIVSRCKL